MSQSIDFRINDFIAEYLDYKGFHDTVTTFFKERKTRQEPIEQLTNGNNTKDADYEKYKLIKNEMLKYFDDGNRTEFFRLWVKHVPSNVIDSDPSLKSLEFLLYAHFAIYFLRPTTRNKNELAAKENMQEFKTYMESIKGQAISQTNDILPLFALPFVQSPDKHNTFQDLFSNEWPVQIRKKLSNFFDWIFSNRSLPRLVELLQNGERATHMLTHINNENDELKHRNKETNKQIKNLSSDYCNLISITMELVETLQQAIVGKTITNEYIDNVCARLGLDRLRESMSHAMESARLGMDDPFTEKFDYEKIKRDAVHPSTAPRQKALLLQALRWKLTKATTDFNREKMLDSYIGCDLLGCGTDMEHRTKILKELSSTLSTTGAVRFVKEEWARLINTIASLRKGRNYLSTNEPLIINMQKAAISEQSDTPAKQHLLAALQKLSLRRSVQTIMINENMIKWLVPLLSKSNELSDYTLEYGVALLMNLCLRDEGRHKCAEIAEQAIVTLAALLTHPNHETRPYINSSLYSILTLKSVREKAIQLNLENRLRTLIRTETTNPETKGQLEFLLNLLCKSGDQNIEHSTDSEQDNDDEDQDVMEADLDLADKLVGLDQELSGDNLMRTKYALQQKSLPNTQKSYNNAIYASTANDFKSKTSVDPVLYRPTTPGQLRQSIVAHTVDSLANSLAVGDIFHSQTNGFELSNSKANMFMASASMSIKKPSSASVVSSIASTVHNNNSTKFSKTVSSTTRPKSTNRTLSNGQQKQVTPVLAFASDEELDRSIPTVTTPKATPPMKFSFSEPPRSNSSASIRSSTSSVLELSNGTLTNHRAKKL